MLLDAAFEEANLFEAWRKVQANAGMAGIDGQGIEQYAVNVFGRLQTLAHQVLRKEYRPQPLRQFGIPKSNGDIRYLAVPTVRDRVAQTAVARVLNACLEGEFEHASYAYRAGRSVRMAVARVAHYRDQGFQWVVDADIQSYFDRVNHRLLIDKLQRSLQDHSLLPLIELWLAATIAPEQGAPRLLTCGIPQGSPISPLLANLYLDDFDEALLGENLRLVRFADDFLVLCRNREEAEQALELTTRVIGNLELKLNNEKTRIIDFEQGFRFLGVDFIRNLMTPAEPDAGPWVIPDAAQRQAAAQHDADNPLPLEDPEETEYPELSANSEAPAESVASQAVTPQTFRQARRGIARRLPEPDEAGEEEGEPYQLEAHHELSPALRSLYVSEQGVMLLKENERVLIAKKHDVLLSWPLGKLDEIVIFGNALVSSALLRHCAREEIVVSFADHHGNIAAAIDGGHGRYGIETLEGQLVLKNDPDHVLMFARALVDGKIHNQRVLLRRYNRRRKNEEIEMAELLMAGHQKQLPQTRTPDEVRGHEGRAARLYFGALAKLLPPEWGFGGRNRRPATDPVNALLSLGYGILYKTVLTCLQRQRLHPYIGNLHAVKPGHAALASDLMEEFRAPVVDTAILQLVLEKQVRLDEFEWDAQGKAACQIGETARKRLLAALAAKYRARLIHPQAGQMMDYHRAILYQANHYRRIVEGRDAVYHPFKLR